MHKSDELRWSNTVGFVPHWSKQCCDAVWNRVALGTSMAVKVAPSNTKPWSPPTERSIRVAGIASAI
jgi:hypothetical protein